MKTAYIRLIPVIILSALLAACGGGGGSDDGIPDGYYFRVNVSSESEGTTTSTYTGGITSTPSIAALVFEGMSNQIMITVSDSTTFNITLVTGGTTTTTYNVTGGPATAGNGRIDYILMSGQTTTAYGGTSGSITLTAVGAEAQPITGSFDTIVTRGTDTKRVWGTFTVERNM